MIARQEVVFLLQTLPDNPVWDSHLPAECRKEHHQLDIDGDHHQLCFLLIDEGGHIIVFVTENRGPKRYIF